MRHIFCLCFFIIQILGQHSYTEVSHFNRSEFVDDVNWEIDLFVEWATDVPCLVGYLTRDVGFEFEDQCSSSNTILFFVDESYASSDWLTHSRTKFDLELVIVFGFDLEAGLANHGEVWRPFILGFVKDWLIRWIV